MPWSASTSATVAAPVCTETGGGAGVGQPKRCAARWRSRPARRAGSPGSGRRTAPRRSGPGRVARSASSTVSAVVQTSRCWPLMVRVSSRARSSAICEPSAIWVSAAGATTSCSPVCSPAEDSAPSTDPARVVTSRCSPSTVMVTCLAMAAAVPPPTASRPMVAAAATSSDLAAQARAGRAGGGRRLGGGADSCRVRGAIAIDLVGRRCCCRSVRRSAALLVRVANVVGALVHVTSDGLG